MNKGTLTIAADDDPGAMESRFPNAKVFILENVVLLTMHGSSGSGSRVCVGELCLLGQWPSQ